MIDCAAKGPAERNETTEHERTINLATFVDSQLLFGVCTVPLRSRLHYPYFGAVHVRRLSRKILQGAIWRHCEAFFGLRRRPEMHPRKQSSRGLLSSATGKNARIPAASFRQYAGLRELSESLRMPLVTKYCAEGSRVMPVEEDAGATS